MKRLIAVLGLALTACFGLALLSTDAQAFQYPWTYSATSVNVPFIDTRFYDDVPVGIPVSVSNGVGLEAGLLMFTNNQPLNETLYAYTIVNIPYTSSYRYLEVRAAQSDGGFFRVGYGFSPASDCTVWPTALAWPTGSGTPYLTRAWAVPIPTNGAVRRVCLLLSDFPDALATGTSKVLIDYIRFRNASNMTGWIENFYGSP